MAFIKGSDNVVIAFAEFYDVMSADQRLFEANEGLTEDIIEDFTVRATERILSLIKGTDWWRDIYNKTSGNQALTKINLPALDPNLIINRQNDFTDLCVYYALWNYILPKIADFSREDNAERAKIGFYQGKFQFLFDELINAGDWYDFNASGLVESTERLAGSTQLKRIR